MSLTELMSGADLDGYAQISLILFLLAFVLILWRIFAPRFRSTYDRAARLPLDDDETTPKPPSAPEP